MDVVLVAPHEKSLRDKILFRENNVKTDYENLTENSVNFMFIKFLKDNLGIASIASYLRRFGHTAKLINSYLTNMSLDELCDDIIAENPIIVGISLLYDLHSYHTCEIVKLLRKKGYTGHITLGGPFISLTYEYFLHGLREIDSTIRGEGEITLLNLLEKIEHGENWKDIPGMAYLQNEKVIVNVPGIYERELDNLPLVARDLYIELVGMLQENNVGTRVASIYTSRGCMGRCTYCSASELGSLVKERWRCRSVDSIMEEIKYLVNEFGVKYINIIDENFYGYGEAGKQRLYDFANAVIDSGIQVKFWAEVRVDVKFDEELFRLLKKAGLQDVLLGLESGSQATLNRWRKGTTVAQNKKAVEFIRNMGFALEPSFILVDPHTTLEEFKDTVAFIDELKIYETAYPLNLFNQLIVFPGTEIERQLVKENIIQVLKADEIDSVGDDEQDIFRFCQTISSRNYEIIDPVIRTMWNVLVFFTNAIAFITDDFITAFTRYCKSKSKDEEKKKFYKNINSEFIVKAGRWRRNIGKLVINILKESIKCAEESGEYSDSLEKDLQEKLHQVVTDYSVKMIGENVEQFMNYYVNLSGFDGYKDNDFTDLFVKNKIGDFYK